jgi:hypothetical protein
MPTWLPPVVVTAVLTGLLTVISRLWTARDVARATLQTERDLLNARIEAMNERLVRQEERMASQAPYFASMQSHVIDLLHHPDPSAGELDGLLDKLKDLTITEGERGHLHALLITLAADTSADPVQRHGASTLLAIMPLVREEAIRDPAGSARIAALPIHPTDIPLMADPQAQAIVRKQLAQAVDKLVGIQSEEHEQTDRIIAQLKESLHIPVATRSMPIEVGTSNAPPYQHQRSGDR